MTESSYLSVHLRKQTHTLNMAQSIGWKIAMLIRAFAKRSNVKLPVT